MFILNQNLAEQTPAQKFLGCLFLKRHDGSLRTVQKSVRAQAARQKRDARISPERANKSERSELEDRSKVPPRQLVSELPL